MAKLLVFIVAMATLGGLGYWAMYRAKPFEEAESAHQQLENVHQAADRIEQQQAEHLDDILEKTKGE